MSEAFRWWLILQVVGTTLLPLSLVMFRLLPDRGYALSKTFALLLLGYVFWLLNSIHVLPNSPRGIVAALVLLALLSGWIAYHRRDEMLAWASEHWRYIVAVEMVLLVVFAVGVWIRSYVGTISGTEQPMDLMFLNAATRAGHFPPEDPWLAGHDVAYYYFGYLIVAMVGQLAGVPTQIGYNIGLAMIAALAFTGAFGIVYNLIAPREASRASEPPPRDGKRARGVPAAALNWRPPAFALAGALMLIVMGNLVFVFHFLSAYGFGGDGFYHWLNVDGLTASETRKGWYPSEFFAFFNASRIYPLDAGGGRVITEFPMFSFLLGDLHPHVMALPFVLLAVSLALALYRSPEPLDITYWLQRPLALVAGAVILGALAFINTWDIATMAFVIVAAAFVSNYLRLRRLTGDLFLQIVSFAPPLVLLAGVAYIPFYASFSSQANGLGAVVTNTAVTEPGTRPEQLLLFWLPLFAVVMPLPVARIAAARERISAAAVGLAAAVPVAVVVGWVLLFGWQKATDSTKLAGAGGLATQIGDRGSGWLTALLLGALLATALLALWAELTARDGDDERQGPIFTLLLAVTGLLLVLGTEFFYVGDVFNSRMNTVFKLYYQAWLLLSLAGGFSLYYLAASWRFTFRREAAFRAGWATAVAIVLLGAALYPLGGTFNRTDGFDAKGQLRGLHWMPKDELAAIDFLAKRADGQNVVIAEAVGPDYRENARVSAATGLPAILGWQGHENQWRGSDKQYRGRFEAVNELYMTPDLNRARQILDQFGVTYVYVGRVERTTYGDAALEKFRSLPVAFNSGAVTIYLAKGVTGEVASAP